MLKPFCLGLFLASVSFSSGLQSPSIAGSSQSLLQPGSSSFKVKTLAPSLFGGAGDGSGSGKIVNGVNIFNGQPYYSIPLGSISSRTLSYPITLTYTGGTKNVVENDNERAPTSWVGLGFNLSFPFVAVNHKGTFASSDDVIFCDLGPYGNGQILVNDAGNKYYLSSNPYIKVDYDTGTSGEYSGQFLKWVFTFPDGKKMLFGQDANSQRYLQYNKGVIKASPYTTGSNKFIYRWDLNSYYDTIPNRSPRNKIAFEYDQYLDSAAPEKFYVRDAYIKNVKWMEGSQEVERYEFKTIAKGASEYVGYAENEPRFAQKLFETRKLDSLKCYKEGNLTHFYKLAYTIPGTKALLASIGVYYPKPLNASASVQDSGWTFSYEGASKFHLLKSVTTPSSREDRYSYASFNFTGTDGASDANIYTMKRADNTSDIVLPSDTATLGGWKTQNTCDERFCFMLARGYDGASRKLYVEIKRNLGNFFDPRSSDSSASPVETITSRVEFTVPGAGGNWDWSLIPAGDYFLLVEAATGQVVIYEYNGIKWALQSPFAGDSRVIDSSGWGYFADSLKVAVAPNYFVVFKKGGSNHEAIVAYRNEVGWTSLNRNTSSCDFNNKSDYGESIRNTATAPCMQWTRASQSLYAAPNYFLVLDSATNVFNAYALKKDLSGFEEISSKIAVATKPSGLQMTGKPMNWDKVVVEVAAAPDYFVVCSQNGLNQGLSTYVNAFFFDGDSLKNIADTSVLGTAYLNTRVFASEEYFVMVNQSKTWFWQSRSTGGGVIRFDLVDTVRTGMDSTWQVKVEAHRNGFSLEYYPGWPGNLESYGYRPKHRPDGNYAAYLYQVSRDFQKGFADRTSNLLNGTVKPFGISFSQSDNVLTFLDGRNDQGLLCNENVDDKNCAVRFYTARTHPDQLVTFADELKSVDTLALGTPLKQQHKVLSNAARIGTALTLDPGTHRVRYSHMQFGGKGFIKPDSQFVVTEASSSASLADQDKNKIRYAFLYNPSNAGIVEFNSNVQLPQFEVVDVKQIHSNPSAKSPDWQRFFFHLDSRGNPMNGKTQLLNGAEKNTRHVRGSWDTVTSVAKFDKPYRHSSWPKPLYTHRTTAVYSKISAKNTSWMADTTRYFSFSDTNGAARFSLNYSRPQKIMLSQSIFDSLGFTTQSMAYKLPTFPDTDFIKVWDPTRPYSNTGAVGAAKTLFKGYLFSEDSIWLEQDQSLTDANLRAGVSPTFRLDEGWYPGSKITLRDTNFNQIVEAKRAKSKAPGALGETYTSFFHEGLRSDLVATVQDAKLENCAILMAENGNANLAAGKLDHRGRWESPGATFTSSLSYAHTGRHSIKVTDHFGPTINLKLKDVRELGFGFKVSAWIFADGGAPALKVERRRWDGFYTVDSAGGPVIGSSGTQRVWQRWEFNLSHAQLTADNLFNNANDYLRIWIGTGAPTGISSKIIYVDDIVCVPSNSTFSLVTFDHRGQMTSATNSNHISSHFDIGFKGNVIGVRDDRFRLVGQYGGHKMGEN